MHGRLIHKQRELQHLLLLVDKSAIVPEDDKSLLERFARSRRPLKCPRLRDLDFC